MSTYFVAGASRGIGIELVKQLLEKYEGKVIAGARNPTGSADLQQLKQKFSDRLTLVTLDLTSDQSVNAAAESIAKSHPEGIDYIINNAGVHERKEIDSTPEGIVEAVNTNTAGPLRVIRAFVPLIKKGKKKVIVNTSSTAASISAQQMMQQFGQMTGASVLGYRVSKAALNLMTVALALEYAADGIIIVPVHPGEVNTDMAKNSVGNMAGGKEMLEKMTITPAESARLQLEFYHKLKVEDSGKFFNYKGESLPW